MLGEHGFTSKVLPYAPSDKVPLFVLVLGIKPSVNQHIVLNIDLAPTILELAGIKIPGNIHGNSLCLMIQDAYCFEKSICVRRIGHLR